MFQVKYAHQEPWIEDSACRNLLGSNSLDQFFSEDLVVQQKCKQFCQECDVRTECLEYAFRENIDFGIFGGLTDKERRTLKHKLGVRGLTRMFAGVQERRLL